jgi:hypothetical protein
MARVAAECVVDIRGQSGVYPVQPLPEQWQRLAQFVDAPLLYYLQLFNVLHLVL